MQAVQAELQRKLAEPSPSPESGPVTVSIAGSKTAPNVPLPAPARRLKREAEGQPLSGGSFRLTSVWLTTSPSNTKLGWSPGDPELEN